MTFEGWRVEGVEIGRGYAPGGDPEVVLLYVKVQGTALGFYMLPEDAIEIGEGLIGSASRPLENER
jgi:hypothetical protein